MWNWTAWRSQPNPEPAQPAIDECVSQLAAAKAHKAEVLAAGCALNQEFLAYRTKYQLIVDPLGRIVSCECSQVSGKAEVQRGWAALLSRAEKWRAEWNQAQQEENAARQQVEPALTLGG